MATAAKRSGLVYRIECAIGNREYQIGKFAYLTVTWQSIGIGWRGSWALWACREFPGVALNLIVGDEWYSLHGFQRNAV